jgi:hypothetical protein
MLRAYFVLVISTLLVSCKVDDSLTYEPVYAQQKMQIPFFQRRGEVEGEVSYSGAFEVAGGYAVSDNIAGVGCWQIMGPRSKNSNFHRSGYGDVGVGYFRTPTGPFRLEGFLRVGTGITHVVDQALADSVVGFFDYDFRKYSIQLDAGYEWSEWHVAVAYRAGLMDISNLQRVIRNVARDSEIDRSIEPSLLRPFVDVALTTRYSPVPAIAVELQFVGGGISDLRGFSYPGAGNDSKNHLTGSVGVQARF